MGAEGAVLKKVKKGPFGSGLAIIHFPFAVVSPILLAEQDIDDSIIFARRDRVPLGNSIIRPLPFSLLDL